jgi:hypothetical protein
MTSEQVDRATGVSIRLVQILRVYCHELDRDALAELRRAIAAGRHRWFAGEFAAAIRDRAFTTEGWCEAIGLTPPTPGAIRDQQRVVWTALFRYDAFPEPAIADPDPPDDRPPSHLVQTGIPRPEPARRPRYGGSARSGPRLGRRDYRAGR